MTDRVVVAGIIWTCLVAAVSLLTLCRIGHAIDGQTLTRVHFRLRDVVQSEDRLGIALTVTAFVCTVIFAFLLAHQVLILR